MGILHRCCAGLDVHKEVVVACVRKFVDGTTRQQVRTFRTETSQLLALADWLTDEGVSVVALESTGVYWKPIWNLFEDAFEVILVQCARAASRSKGTYLQAMYDRLAARRGQKRALVAVAHRLLEVIYNVLKKGQDYREPGEDYLDKKQDTERLKQRLLKRLGRLGLKVTVEEPVAVA